MGIIGNPLLLGEEGGGPGPSDYQIPRSLRFNSADSAYLNRTPSAAGNRKTWTWSGWVKLADISAQQTVFAASTDGSNRVWLRFNNGPLELQFEQGGAQTNLNTNAVYRDPSAWYHIVVAVDTTQATASNRSKIYVNGEQVTSFSTEQYPSQNYDTYVNGANLHRIGCVAWSLAVFADSYMADVFLIDGQALDPTSFGEYDSNNVWQPKEYTGDFTIGPVYSNNSSGGALFAGTSWAQAFNGSLSNGPFTYSSTSNTLTLPPEVTWSSQIRVYALRYGGIFEINGTDVSSGIGTSAAWHDLTSTLGSSGTLSTIEIGDAATNYVKLFAVELDGQILIDSSGLNSFHLDFSDNSTAAALGTDTSGNSNTWTVNNISVTAGAGNDSLVDSPTNGDQTDTGVGGEVVGNYATLNPLTLARVSGTPASGLIKNGNLDFEVSSGTNNNYSVNSSISVTSGKWYFEMLGRIAKGSVIGVRHNTSSSFNKVSDGVSVFARTVNNNWTLYKDGIALASTQAAANNDLLGCALDADNGTVQYYINNVAFGSSQSFSSLGVYTPYFYLQGASTTTEISVNFGQRPFAYTAPSGFKALCTANLPDPTIADGSTAMDVVTYTGNQSTLALSGVLNFSPDFIWIKERAFASFHALFNTVMGTGGNHVLHTNNTNAASGNSGDLLTFTPSDGFTVNSTWNGATSYLTNRSAGMVAWCWDAGSSTVSNTDGSITSQVRANPSAGFSIISWTGTGVNASIGHGLGVAPMMTITKNRADSGTPWVVDLIGILPTSPSYLLLNSTQAAGAGGSTATSSVVNILQFNDRNGSTDPMIMYAFAPVDGYSAFGSYTGNGSANGPFVYTGFRPRWLLLRCSSILQLWLLLDSERDEYNVVSKAIQAHTSDAEIDNATNYGLDFTSNGFKVRSLTDRTNGSGQTYIYAAFAEHPFAMARAR